MGDIRDLPAPPFERTFAQLGQAYLDAMRPPSAEAVTKAGEIALFDSLILTAMQVGVPPERAIEQALAIIRARRALANEGGKP